MKEKSKIKLTLKQKAFADYYIKLGNATQAAKKAGYSKKTASVIGIENLRKPNVKSYIDTKVKKIEDGRIADAKEVMEFLTRVVRNEEKEQMVVTENTGDYTSEARIITKEVSAKDKIKAAELLGKRYSLFTERLEADVNQTVVFAGEDDLEDD